MKGKSSDNSSASLRPSIPVLPSLNHFYVVLDSTTCHAIEEDVFLRTHFAVNERRTTTNAEMTYTGFYFYGVNTYFEFFDIADFPRHRVGDSGIAFGFDQPGTIRALQEKLASSLEPSLKSVTRLQHGKQIPWFSMATPKSLPYESELSCWVMEYDPEFLANWNPQPKGTNQGILRREILQRYSEILNPVDDAILEDVIGLTVAADVRATGSLIDFCLQLGYQIERTQNGDVVLHGPDLILRMIPATESFHGIREITMRTRSRSQSQQESQLGRSVLKFVGPLASWSFR